MLLLPLACHKFALTHEPYIAIKISDIDTTLLFHVFLIRLFQPVQYGTKPEGRLAAITGVAGQHPPTSSPATSTSVSTTSQSAQTRGKSAVTTATSTAASHGKSVPESTLSNVEEKNFHKGHRDSRWCHLTSNSRAPT